MLARALVAADDLFTFLHDDLLLAAAILANFTVLNVTCLYADCARWSNHQLIGVE